MKFFRSDNLDRFVRDFLNESFRSTFIAKSQSNLEQLANLNWFNRPVIVFYKKLDICYNNLIEMKNFRLNAKKMLTRIVLADEILENSLKELENSIKEQKWVIIQNLNSLNDKNQMNFFKKINILCQNLLESSKVKIWIFYQITSKKSRENENSSLNSFFCTCSHIFINSAISIKSTLEAIFSYEKEEFKGHLSQKAHLEHMKTINMNTFASRNIKIQFHDLLFHHMTKLRKRVHSFNLHSFIDVQQLREKNSIFISIIEAGSKKIRFTICFLFAILKIRRIYEKNLFSRFSGEENQIFIGGNDILLLLEDGFQFLDLFTINPLVFLEKLISFMLNEDNLYHNSFNHDMIKSLLKEYVTSSQEKQLVITVGNYKYELYKFMPNSSYEENVTKTISEFPNEDPVDILGFNVNNEFQYNYKRSGECMKVLREFYRNQTILQEKCEIEEKIWDSIVYEKKMTFEGNNENFKGNNENFTGNNENFTGDSMNKEKNLTGNSMNKENFTGISMNKENFTGISMNKENFTGIPLNNENFTGNENYSQNYMNILSLLQELNISHSLQNRIKLIDSMLVFANETVSFRWTLSKENREPYIDEDTIKEWFSERNEENANLEEKGLEIINFKKLHLSLKRNTSVRSSIKRMSKVFTAFLNPNEEFETKSCMIRSKFSVFNTKLSCASGMMKEIPKNMVIFVFFLILLVFTKILYFFINSTFFQYKADKNDTFQ